MHRHGELIAAHAADWPHFRGPDSNGTAPDKGINKDWKAKPPKQLWSVDMGDNGFAGPCVAAGKVFIIDHAGGEDIVRAYDLASGKEAWKFPYADPAKDAYGFAHSSPAFDSGKLYTLSRTGQLNCIDASNGKPVWSHNLRADFQGQTGNWEYAASPIVDGNKLDRLSGRSKMAWWRSIRIRARKSGLAEALIRPAMPRQ